ncbi:peptidase M17 [Elizabethkingia meningoseptica]|uniref:M17 family metallopeptidase n=1 Tax=Elizabethkingia meningoseptica TaxID=238 RepID=UPI000332D2AF|nr:leucyl aminopeptidase family protein [Elizabethkingia meningoseptica]AQX04757.1 peptidase M17 [Elizabethkingia meningoseptica]AQX46799.1 peptidase M17 [Elizabethkingia meningoseptica]EOR31225.1 Leucyl aminopeptidase [Elizabethkingia meningoseptica ATCC 13253 = NBRC 12535]KUY19312.1 peptidase M17 [Elizabethkingia meningoseptica]MDE5489920.1 leucyl aminopeptidase family protein [Elizabethkingia meningoseptica]
MSEVTQHIHIYSESSWKDHKQLFPETLLHFFSGKKNESFVLASEDKITLFIGIGDSYTESSLVEVSQKFSNDYKDKIQILPTFLHAEILTPHETEQLLLGFYLGTYLYPFKAVHPLWNEHFKWENIELSDEKFSKIKAICNGQFICMDWLNKPANFKQAPKFHAFLKEKSHKYNFDISFFNRQQCEDLGLGAFLAVNQGSNEDAYFTILEYRSNIKDAPVVGLVGKCVLFDTGGISIKPAANLHYMKSDMGGATAVLGALISAIELKLPVDIIAILPITDNAVSNNAYLPSDVVTAYNGKTIEVIDTDAEGRMTLADGLSYLSKNYKTDYLIDLATLTGSAVRMFGTTCGALFSNDPGLQKLLEDSGQKVGQRLWNLPLWEDWEDEIKSDVADLKNISLKPVGDCIVAATFLKHFINDHPKWAHLDIAAMCFGNVGYAREKAATGYGVRLLLDFMEKI